MSQISTLQREIYGSCELMFVKPSRQRSKSLPILRRRRRTLEEKQAPGKRRERSASLRATVKHLHERILSGFICGSVDDDDSDSDEEDRRNTVPMVYTLRRGGEFNSDMKIRVAERHQELLEHKYELHGELYTAKQRYNDACERLHDTACSNWDADTYRRHRDLEENYLNLTRKLLELDNDLNELQAMLLSLGDGVPMLVDGQWDMNRRAPLIWSLDNASYEWESPDSLAY
ncbi:hypothetical protein F4774DRAFT_273613 [Daldinia eschscholtzii]|nr:hypothetical protein F4774DRAFT_273613 [Daldinia eschscholtzii]